MVSVFIADPPFSCCRSLSTRLPKPKTQWSQVVYAILFDIAHDVDAPAHKLDYGRKSRARKGFRKYNFFGGRRS